MEALMDPVVIIVTLVIAIWLFRKITHILVRAIIVIAAVCIICGTTDLPALLASIASGM